MEQLDRALYCAHEPHGEAAVVDCADANCSFRFADVELDPNLDDSLI